MDFGDIYGKRKSYQIQYGIFLSRVLEKNMLEYKNKKK